MIGSHRLAGSQMSIFRWVAPGPSQGLTPPLLSAVANTAANTAANDKAPPTGEPAADAD